MMSIDNGQSLEILVRDAQAEDYTAMVATRGEAWWWIAQRTLINELQIKKNDIVCDAGCGVGIYTREIVRRFPNNQVWAVDFSVKSLNVLKLATNTSKVNTLVGDLINFKLPHPVDALLCTEAILHIPSEKLRVDAMKNLFDTLNPGGKIVIAVVPFTKRSTLKITDNRGKGGYYSYRFTPKELMDIVASAGFENIQVRGCVNFRGFIRSRLPKWLWWTDVMFSKFPFSAKFGHLIFCTAVRPKI
ncbi:MAG: class I SAM-dependent methyltransferase [Armatimonadetes bacterium]|nr:class I SAM-dependent methyltransferase [Armatimonadota bacterium]